MNPVSAQEFALIRSDAAAVLDQACTIQRKTTNTADGYGTSVPTWTTVSSAGLLVEMRQPSAGQLQMYASKLGSLASWLVRLPSGTNVQVQDHLIIAGQTMVVQVLLTPQSYSALDSVLATAVKP